MPKAADIGTKKLISLAPDDWLRWVTQRPNIVARDILSSELLNELQLRYTPWMPKRMRAYAGLAEERYDLPIYPVLVNILPPPAITTIETRYESRFLDLYAHPDYRVINLWEVEADLVFQQPLPLLLPFVPILRGGGDSTTVQAALRVLRADEQLSQFEPLLAFFASFVLETRLVQQIMRWDMVVLEESP